LSKKCSINKNGSVVTVKRNNMEVVALIWAIIALVLGLGTFIFAKQIGAQQQRFNTWFTKYLGDGISAKIWQSYVNSGAGLGVKLFRIGGIVVMGEGIFLMWLYFYKL
jgi:hypothetical protein